LATTRYESSKYKKGDNGDRYFLRHIIYNVIVRFWLVGKMDYFFSEIPHPSKVYGFSGLV
jgi:hypothetical protein